MIAVGSYYHIAEQEIEAISRDENGGSQYPYTLKVKTKGDREMTASEITEELVQTGKIPYFNRNYVAPRLTELKDMGVVKTVGRRKATRSDATEAVWARVQVSGYADAPAAKPAGAPATGDQISLLGPGA